MTYKCIKDLEPGDVFLYNGVEYQLIERDERNRRYKADCLCGTGQISLSGGTYVDVITKIAKVSEFLEDKKENVVDKDKEKISNIIANSPDKKLKLYLGCFNKPIPGFVNVDIRPYPETLCDVVDDILKLEKFEDGIADVILSVHTLEHVGRYEYTDALKTWYKKLKKNGEVFISVPDMQAVCEHYIYHHDLSFLYSFIWGSQKHEADKHYCGFDFDLLKKSLEEVGFGNVERYDWTKTPWAYIDSYAGAYAKHLDRNSRLMSLNVKATKL